MRATLGCPPGSRWGCRPLLFRSCHLDLFHLSYGYRSGSDSKSRKACGCRSRTKRRCRSRRATRRCWMRDGLLTAPAGASLFRMRNSCVAWGAREKSPRVRTAGGRRRSTCSDGSLRLLAFGWSQAHSREIRRDGKLDRVECRRISKEVWLGAPEVKLTRSYTGLTANRPWWVVGRWLVGACCVTGDSVTEGAFRSVQSS